MPDVIKRAYSLGCVLAAAATGFGLGYLVARLVDVCAWNIGRWLLLALVVSAPASESFRIAAQGTPWLFELRSDEPQKWPALPPGVWRVAQVTSYCPCSICTDGDHITANGTSTDRVPYDLAADHELPMGSEVFIPAGVDVLDRVRATARVFKVDDRGPALDQERAKDKHDRLRLDLRVREHWYARQFGRRLVPVYVIAKPSTEAVGLSVPVLFARQKPAVGQD